MSIVTASDFHAGRLMPNRRQRSAANTSDLAIDAVAGSSPSEAEAAAWEVSREYWSVVVPSSSSGAGPRSATGGEEDLHWLGNQRGHTTTPRPNGLGVLAPREITDKDTNLVNVWLEHFRCNQVIGKNASFVK